jgi:uncharacterized delta-60 repeat protein
MSCKWIIVILVIAKGIGFSNGQAPGSLDLTYGVQGKQIIPLGTGNSLGRALAIQPDGKSIMAGIANNGASTDFALLRLTTDGQPDLEFGDDGKVLTDFDSRTDIAEAIVLDDLNRIIVAGSVESTDGFDFAVARYLPDGNLDGSFAIDGFATTTVGVNGFCKAVAIQEDKKIVLGGYAINPLNSMNEFVMVRYRTDGVIDSTFDHDGIVKTNMDIGSGVANAMLIQPDGKIVLAGQVLNESTFAWEIGIARYNEDGSLDESWGDFGIVLTASPLVSHTINAVALRGDQKIVVGGFNGTAPSTNLFTVARYNTNGEIDKTFGTDGLVIDSYGAQDNQINTLVIQPDGHILIAGTTLIGTADHLAIARITEDGAFDDTFGDDGVVVDAFGQNDGVETMALQQDGKLVIGGESFNGNRFSIVVARYETGLATDVHEPGAEVISFDVYPNPATEKITLSYPLKEKSVVRVGLYGADGRLVQLFLNQERSIGDYLETYALSQNIQAGMYWISVEAGKGRMVKKVMVMK